MSVRNFIYPKDLEGSCGQYSVTNCRCDVSAFDLRKSMWRLSKIDVTMCRPSEIDDRRVDLRRSVIDVSIFEDRCVGLRRSMVDLKLGCYTCSKH